MRLLIVRHGETESNARRVLQGHLPIPLSERGFAQAKAVARRLANRSIDAVYTSDLPRARQTAEEIAKLHPLAAFCEDRRLRERDMGDYAGKEFDSLEFPRDPDTPVPNGESMAAQRRRLKEFYEELPLKHANGTVLVVTHGGSVKLLINIIRNAPISEADFGYGIKNTSVTEFEIGGGVRQVTLNCDKHLG